MGKQAIVNLSPKSTGEYFQKLVQDGMKDKGIEANFIVKKYLASLLERYIDVRNLFVEEENTGKMSSQTLAEMFLQAHNTSNKFLREDMLRRTAETSLYISGFFGDSFNKKIVGIEYYIYMGGNAYSILADIIEESVISDVYVECAERFLNFVEVLSFISDRSFVNGNENILSLYERYLQTGSTLARKKLFEKGILTSPHKIKKT